VKLKNNNNNNNNNKKKNTFPTIKGKFYINTFIKTINWMYIYYIYIHSVYSFYIIIIIIIIINKKKKKKKKRRNNQN